MIAVPIILVTVNKIIEYFTFINTGAEFNVMIVDVTDRVELIIKTRVKIKISLYSEYINRFLEIIENILISIDLIVYRINIFVTRLAPQSFILKISYLYSTRAQLLFNDDSIQILLRSTNGRREIYLVD